MHGYFCVHIWMQWYEESTKISRLGFEACRRNTDRQNRLLYQIVLRNGTQKRKQLVHPFQIVTRYSYHHDQLDDVFSNMGLEPWDIYGSLMRQYNLFYRVLLPFVPSRWLHDYPMTTRDAKLFRVSKGSHNSGIWKCSILSHRLRRWSRLMRIVGANYLEIY